MTIKIDWLLLYYRYPHLQLTDDKGYAGVFMNHLAPEIHQCNDSFKDYLTQSTTQNACEWRILRDDSLQGFDADFREQSPWWKYALNSMTLNQHIDTGNLGSVLDTCKKDLVRSLNESFKGGLINIAARYDSLNSYYKLCYKNYVHSPTIADLHYICFTSGLFIIIVSSLFYTLDRSISSYPQSRALEFNNDAPLPMDTNVNPG